MTLSLFSRITFGFVFCVIAAVATAAAPIEIPGAQPQLTVAADGRVWLAYGRVGEPIAAPASSSGGHGHHGGPRPEGDVLVAHSEDGGVTFSPSTKIGTVQNLMLGMRRGPRIAVHGDRITVTVIGPELFSFVSGDGGKTWSDPVTINDVPTSAREGLHDLAGSAQGELFVTWLDLRNGTMELWGAASTDGGLTWAKNQRVYRSSGKSICECCHPSALFDEQGHLAIMWRNAVDGSRDMWMTTRESGAVEFTPARKLGEGTWKIEGCPMDGGRILAFGDGQFGAVWQRNGEIFLTRGDGPEITLGKGKQPVAVHPRDGALTVFWQQGADLVGLTDIEKPVAVKQVSDARFPSVAALPGGKGMLVAYERGPKDAPTIAVERR